MTNSKVVFDTNIYIDHPLLTPPRNLLLSSVVVMECIAGRYTDDSAVKDWQRTYRAYEKDGDLLVPTAEDWWFTGKVLNALGRGLPVRGKRAETLSPDEVRRLIRDVLIARTAKRANAALVTKTCATSRKLNASATSN
jgi:predicted nucleic acid-binding protein